MVGSFVGSATGDAVGAGIGDAVGSGTGVAVGAGMGDAVGAGMGSAVVGPGDGAYGRRGEADGHGRSGRRHETFFISRPELVASAEPSWARSPEYAAS